MFVFVLHENDTDVEVLSSQQRKPEPTIQLTGVLGVSLLGTRPASLMGRLQEPMDPRTKTSRFLDEHNTKGDPIRESLLYSIMMQFNTRSSQQCTLVQRSRAVSLSSCQRACLASCSSYQVDSHIPLPPIVATGPLNCDTQNCSTFDY